VGWVVKEWNGDGLERLLSDRSLESVRATRLAAERDARRAARVADRAMAEAEARLDALESLGRELQLVVRTRRAALRLGSAAGEVRPAALPIPVRVPRAIRPPGAPAPEPPGPSTPPAPPRRGGRASLRASPLTELFRPTEPRRPSA
jgi:hypothetical protein